MQAVNTATTSASERRDDETQYLTFSLDGQTYGIPILQIQEIRGWTAVTPLPNSPAHIKGVLNLRGTIIPVIDLRSRFNLPAREYDALTVIVVVNLRNHLAGLVVDAVSDVVNAGADRERETPDFEGRVNRLFIRGLLEVNGDIITVLNTDELDDTAAAAAAA
jgi:purine-binding chemotaxis protein CheW